MSTKYCVLLSYICNQVGVVERRDPNQSTGYRLSCRSVLLVRLIHLLRATLHVVFKARLIEPILASSTSVDHSANFSTKSSLMPFNSTDNSLVSFVFSSTRSIFSRSSLGRQCRIS